MKMLYVLAVLNWMIGALQIVFFPDLLNIIAFLCCMVGGTTAYLQARRMSRA